MERVDRRCSPALAKAGSAIAVNPVPPGLVDMGMPSTGIIRPNRCHPEDVAIAQYQVWAAQKRQALHGVP